MAFLSDKSNHSDRDRIILGIAAELCNQIGKRIVPRKIYWKDRIVRSRGPSNDTVPSDGCEVNGYLTLPARMRTLLAPEDWKPIIAAALIYTWKLRPSRYKHLLTRWVLGGILPLSILITALVLLYSPGDLSLIPVYTIGSSLWMIGPAWLISAPYAKRMRLLADQIAAQTVGRDSFIGILEKIEALGLEDIYKRDHYRGLRARFMTRPSISERIENLKSASFPTQRIG